MACNKLQMHELPGSYNSCQVLIVRECLEVNGADIGPGLTSVVTDGVTTQGLGTTISPIAIKAVQHDGTMTGNGTVASPLSVPAGPPATVVTDGVTVQGDGSGGSPIAIKQVETTDTMTGAGTLASRLNAQKLAGPGGVADASNPAFGVVITSVDGVGGVSIQAQNGTAVPGAGNATLYCDGAAGSYTELSSRTLSAPIKLGGGNTGTGSYDVPTFFLAELRDGAAGVPVPASAAGRARLRYNAGTNRLQVSLNGAAYVDIVTL